MPDLGFEITAKFLRHRGPEANVKIEGFWDDDNTASTRENWRREFEEFMDALWSGREEAMNKHLELSRKFEQVERLEARIAANRTLVGPFEHQLRVGRTNPFATLTTRLCDMSEPTSDDGWTG